MSDRSFSMGQAAASLAGFAQRSGASGFLRWWGAELAPLVPSSARNALARRRMRPVVAFDGAQATLWRHVMREGAVAMERVATIPLDGDAAAVAAAGRQAMGSLARVAYGGATGAPRVRVSIPVRSVLRRTLSLPAAVEENLHQAIGYDLDRLTPFKADELYFDAVVVSRDAARGTVEVDFAAVRRPVVDAAVAHVSAWGAEVWNVSPDAPDAAAPSRLNLVPDEARAAPAPWKRWQFWAPLAALALVAGIAVVLPVWQKRDYAIAIIDRAEAARQQAAVSEQLRGELERAAADYHFVLERKYAWPPVVRVLDTLTRVLPDDTWLTQLELRSVPRGKDRDREIVIRGESGNAGRLIPVIEESGMIVQVAPRSPTTKIQPGPGEVFDLGGQLKPLQKPALVALVGPDAPPPPAPRVEQTPPPVVAAPLSAPAAPAPAPSPPASAADATAPAEAEPAPPPPAPQEAARPAARASPVDRYTPEGPQDVGAAMARPGGGRKGTQR